MSRKPISKRVRFFVLERDGFRCRYCGASSDETILHVDHVRPVALGGLNDPENLVAACADCNLGKAAAMPIHRIARQREVALAALIFQKAAERFGEGMPMWRAFSIILDFCLFIEAPERLLAIVREAATWQDAQDAMYTFAGFPELESEDEE